MSKATFTFRVDETLKSEFSAAAKNCDRNAAQLLRDFMRNFVRQQQEAALEVVELLEGRLHLADVLADGDLPADARARLEALTPGGYTGLAERLARGI